MFIEGCRTDPNTAAPHIRRTFQATGRPLAWSALFSVFLKESFFTGRLRRWMLLVKKFSCIELAAFGFPFCAILLCATGKRGNGNAVCEAGSNTGLGYRVESGTHLNKRGRFRKAIRVGAIKTINNDQIHVKNNAANNLSFCCR